jgi:prepilin-type N-terminal cleavage/methylation domain-containing protein
MRALNRRAFSLIELVIVVVIIGIIAAIAIPRMSRGAAGAAESSLKANLSLLRNALEMFQTENGGVYPANAAAVTLALTGYSDGTGATEIADGTRSAGFVYGPYIRDIPKLGIGANKDFNTFGAAAAAGTAWIYANNDIKANTGNATYDAW